MVVTTDHDKLRRYIGRKARLPAPDGFPSSHSGIVKPMTTYLGSYSDLHTAIAKHGQIKMNRQRRYRCGVELVFDCIHKAGATKRGWQTNLASDI